MSFKRLLYTLFHSFYVTCLL